jgi:hypothetical protein
VLLDGNDEDVDRAERVERERDRLTGSLRGFAAERERREQGGAASSANG